MDELKPCPFCGDTYLKTRKLDSWPTIQCQGCGTIGPSVKIYEKEAIVEWNRRAPSDAERLLRAARDEIEDALANVRQFTNELQESCPDALEAFEELDKLLSSLPERESKESAARQMPSGSVGGGNTVEENRPQSAVAARLEATRKATELAHKNFWDNKAARPALRSLPDHKESAAREVGPKMTLQEVLDDLREFIEECSETTAAKQHVLAALDAIKPLYESEARQEERYFLLNGYRKRWINFSHFNGNVVSYEDVVEWSGIDSDSNIIRERVYTVTYARPHGSILRDGSLTRGESVVFETGMVFNVTRTGAA